MYGREDMTIGAAGARDRMPRRITIRPIGDIERRGASDSMKVVTAPAVVLEISVRPPSHGPTTSSGDLRDLRVARRLGRREVAAVAAGGGWMLLGWFSTANSRMEVPLKQLWV